MSELPQSWAWAPLSAITSDATQKVPAHDEPFEYIDIGSIDRDRKRIASPQPLMGKDAPSRARKQVRAGDTLVSMTRPNLNAVALVPDGLDGQVASTGFDVLRPRGVEPRWPFYLVRTQDFIDAMSSLVQGALYPAVRAKDIRAHVVSIAPMREQSRIADELDTLLARVNACNDRFDAIPALLKRFRTVVLNTAISGGLTSSWRETKEQLQNSKPLALGEDIVRVPETWMVSSLEGIIEPGRSLCYGVVQPGREAHGGMPLIRVQDLAKGTVLSNQLRTVSKSIDEAYKRSRVRGGDLLVSVVGTIGRTAIVPDGLTANIARAIARVACREGVLSRWVHYWLSSEPLQWHLLRSSKEVARKTLNLGDLATIKIALPSSDEQSEIVRRVEALFTLADRIEARCTAARTHVQRLAPQLLAKAFRGELVPQDPTDEPASVLLARIAAERSAAATPLKTRQPRTPRAARAPKETAAMTKSRQDADVSGQPYLAKHLRRLGGQATAELLFKSAELPVADFYKQLAWEVAQGHVLDGDSTLGARDAA